MRNRPKPTRELVENPAKSEAQRKYLYAKFGEEWVREHHFDNPGKLPKKVSTKNAKVKPRKSRVVWLDISDVKTPAGYTTDSAIQDPAAVAPVFVAKRVDNAGYQVIDGVKRVAALRNGRVGKIRAIVSPHPYNDKPTTNAPTSASDRAADAKSQNADGPKRHFNPLRHDPTRTLALRSQFSLRLKGQFDELRRRINQWLVDDDMLGLGKSKTGVNNGADTSKVDDLRGMQKPQGVLRHQTDVSISSAVALSELREGAWRGVDGRSKSSHTSNAGQERDELGRFTGGPHALASLPGEHVVKDVSNPAIGWDLGANNYEIQKAKDKGMYLTKVNIPDDRLNRSKEAYANVAGYEDDHSYQKVKKLEEIKDRLPPLVLTGTKESWQPEEGHHRLMLLAHHGVREVYAYMRNVPRDERVKPTENKNRVRDLDGSGSGGGLCGNLHLGRDKGCSSQETYQPFLTFNSTVGWFEPGRLLGLKDYRQYNHFTCGAAMTKSMADFVGLDVGTVEEVAEELGTTVEQSTHPDAIVEFFRERGCPVEVHTGMIVDDLKGYVDKGWPVGVCLQDYMGRRDPKAAFDYGHYVAVEGVNAGYVFAQDSSLENWERVGKDEAGIGGDTPKSQEQEANIDAPGKIMVTEDDWNRVWHDVTSDGQKLYHFGIAVGPPIGVENAFCPGRGVKDNSCSSSRQSMPQDGEEADERFSKVNDEIGNKYADSDDPAIFKMRDNSYEAVFSSHNRIITATMGGDEGDYKIHIDFKMFGNIEENPYHEVGERLQKGTIDFMRELMGVAKAYHQAGFKLEVQGATDKRQRVYDKALERAGMKKVHTDVEGTTTWNFNPDQPRDEKGRFGSGGGTSEDTSASPMHKGMLDGLRGIASNLKSTIKQGMQRLVDGLDEESLGGASMILGGIAAKRPAIVAAGSALVFSSVFKFVHQEVFEAALSQHSVPGAAAVAKGLSTVAAKGETLVRRALGRNAATDPDDLDAANKFHDALLDLAEDAANQAMKHVGIKPKPDLRDKLAAQMFAESMVKNSNPEGHNQYTGKGGGDLHSIASSAIKELTAKYGEDQGPEKGLTPREINEGYCSWFANAAVRLIQQKRGREVGVAGKANETEDVHTSRTNMDPEGEGHMWVTVGGKHYDPETPEGVSNPYDLKWFERHKGFHVQTTNATTKEDIDAAAAEADHSPSEAQIKSGTYKKGHVWIQGLPITIETAAGNKRKPWHDKPVSVHYGYLKAQNGVQISEADGDHVDVFIGPDPDSDRVWIVDQYKDREDTDDPRVKEIAGDWLHTTGHPKTRIMTRGRIAHIAEKYEVSEDEAADLDDQAHKLFGAQEGYKPTFDEHKAMLGFADYASAVRAYRDSYPDDWQGMGDVTEMSMDEFKQWLKTGDTSRPVAGAQMVANRLRMVLNEYNPNQPRDDRGRFGSGEHSAEELTGPPDQRKLMRRAVDKARQMRDEFESRLRDSDSRTAQLAVKAKDVLAGIVGGIKSKLESRYGKTAAVAIMASGQGLAWGATGVGAAMGVPVWLPLSSVWGVIPGAAVAEAFLQARRGYKKLTGNAADVKARLEAVLNAATQRRESHVLLQGAQQDEAQRMYQDVWQQYGEWLEQHKDDVLQTRNAFCPGRGAEDNSCSSHRPSAPTSYSEAWQRFDEVNKRLPKAEANLTGEMRSIKAPGNRRIDISLKTLHRPGSSDKEFAVRIDFGIEGKASTHQAEELQAGSLDFMRLVKKIATEYHAAGLKLLVVPSDEKREELYRRVLEKIGAKMERKMGVQGQVWNISSSQEVHNAGDFAFASHPEKIEAFQRWLKTQVGQLLIGQTQEQLWKAFCEQGYRKGAGRAFDDYMAARKKAPLTGPSGAVATPDDVASFYQGGREQFLNDSFNQPVSVERVKVLAGRSFDEMENVVGDMGTKMSRALTDGLVQGKSVRDVAKDLMDVTDFSERRANLVAATELIRSHAHGQLDALKNMGAKTVGVTVEFADADDDRVCPKCAELDGKTFQLDEAYGIIPAHPACRCALKPALPDWVMGKPMKNTLTRNSGERLPRGWSVANSNPEGYNQYKKSPHEMTRQQAKMSYAAHFKVVEQALMEGKEVPDKVLKQYPGMKEMVAAKKQAEAPPQSKSGEPLGRVVAAPASKGTAGSAGVSSGLSNDELGDRVRASFLKLEDKHFGIVPLSEIKRHSGLSLGDLHAGVQHLRHKGEMTGTAYEERRPDPEKIAAGIEEPSGVISHISRRTTNAFCPTGKGGGVDPSCSPAGDLTEDEKKLADEHGMSHKAYADMKERIRQSILKSMKPSDRPEQVKSETKVEETKETKTVPSKELESQPTSMLTPAEGPVEGREKSQARIDRKVTKALEKRSGLSVESQSLCRETMKDALSAMNDKCLDRISLNVLQFRFHEDEYALTKHAVASSAGLKAKLGEYAATESGMSGSTVGGYYDTIATMLHLTAKGTWPTDTYRHELGHAIDGPRMEISRSPEWKAAFSHEIFNSNLGQYAETNEQEGFAEFCRHLHAEKDKKRVEREYPRCFAVWKKWGII